IATITGMLESRPGIDRLRGYRAAAQALGLAYRDEYVAYGDFYAESGRAAAARLLALPEPPTASLAAPALMAIRAVRAAAHAGPAPGSPGPPPPPPSPPPGPPPPPPPLPPRGGRTSGAAARRRAMRSSRASPAIPIARRCACSTSSSWCAARPPYRRARRCCT